MGRYLDIIIEAESTNRQGDKSDISDKSRLEPVPEDETVYNFATKAPCCGFQGSATTPTPEPEEPLNRRVALAAVKRGESVRVVSATLGEAIYWVPDEEAAERLKRAPAYQGEVCYTLDEITKLRGQSAEMLRAVHEFKRELDANLGRVEKGGYPSQAGALVRCGDCQHFQRIDHPHVGRCARGHGQHYLWDRDKRQCKDFLKGDSEQDKAGVIEDLKDRLTESEQRFLASEQSLKITGSELGEAREHIDFLKQSNRNMAEFLEGLRMRVQGLEASLAAER